MTKLIAALGKRLAMVAAPVLGWIFAGGAAAFIAVSGFAAVQSYRLDQSQKANGRAEFKLQVCRDANTENSRALETQRQINAQNIKTMRAAVLNAQEIGRRAVEQQRAVINELETQTEGLAASAVGDDCAGVQPDDVGRLLAESGY